MSAKLTYLFFLSCMAVLASSCSSDASDLPDAPASGKGAELTFSVAGLSRATVTTSFNQFAVYGDMKRPEDTNNIPANVFNKTVVEYRNDGWYYEGKQYWMPDLEHSFVAISPLSVVETDNAPLYQNSQLSFTYSIPTNADNAVASHADVTDIIAATHRRLYKNGDIVNTTTLNFGHVMSLINIAPAFADNIMDADATIEVQKIELSGFKSRANFSIIPAERQSNLQTDDRVITIAGHTADATLTHEFAEPVKIPNKKENVEIFANNDAIIMIPQSFAEDSDAKIVVTYTIDGSTELNRVTLYLRGRSWDMGKSYTYKFTMDRKGLIVDETTITDWEVFNVGNLDAH